ncbi:hypothetical protein A1O3_10248 [Capronia epimyces CBS 606.96]|uniref:Uncharacterized protein n=1 Tax=Capronia epimyces CBS 606.96 TaxID=1182542 RepID=W9XIB4_9EURO|nr:uncharacterized protein A1O3_10248 [Capronia epimyces CBS 606.96]EXJ77090.1 hypothetical protein A1O3_10248 [Capronia epimyces CBS 606.96]
MPALKDLVCQVLWAETGSSFPEYGTQYGDGILETYIAVPDHPQAFCIRLASRKFIYEGLAMVVFIDGEYQCNRNRVNLQPWKKDTSPSKSVVEFVVRQKEKPMGDGTYMGREWRFDDYNIVPELPQGVDHSHFRELGTIEVIVLRCRIPDPEENNMSTASSAADSDVLASRPETDGQTTHQLAQTPQEPDTGAEADNPFAGLPGSFDGPSDEPPIYYGSQGDAPPNGYPRWNWHPQGGQPAPYVPHEAASYPQSYHPNLVYHVPARPSHGYRASPTPSYETPPYRPPKPERRVHFDFGDGRGPQQHRPTSSYVRYDDQARYHGPTAWREEHEYDRPAPQPDYREGPNHRGMNPYSDYPIPPHDRHYMYDAERKAYGYYPEVNLPHDSYRSQTPPGSSFVVHGVPGPAIPPHQTNPPPTAVPMPGPTPVSFPVPPPFPAGPWSTTQPQPAQYPVPVWVPPPAGSAHPFVPGMVPIYPPPHNVPLFHTQGPNPVVSEATIPPVTAAASSGPGPTVTQADVDTAQQPATRQQTDLPDTTKEEAKAATNPEVKDAEDPPKDVIDNTNNNDSNDTWAFDAAAKVSDDKNDTGYANNDSGNDPTWGNDNQDNNDTANNGAGWDQTEQNNKGWENNDQNAGSGNNQANGDWGNNQNDNSNDDAKANDEPTSNAGQANKRALYGPHGAYYTTKAAAETAIAPDAEEEPRYDVPQAIAERIGTSKQVHPGQGYIYSKKRCVPEYIDNLKEPYARFVFKYRTKEQIRKEIGVDIGHEPTADEDANALESLDKAALIEMVLRAKGALGGKIPSPPARFATPTSTQSYEQIPITAPDVDFLTYKLPPSRKVSDGSGLGIQSSTISNKENRSGKSGQQNTNWDAGGETGQQHKNWENGAPNWQEGESNNQAANNGAGWDGQQEQRDSSTFQNDSPTEPPSGTEHPSKAQTQREPSIVSEAPGKVVFQSSGVVQPAAAHPHGGLVPTPHGFTGPWATPSTSAYPSAAPNLVSTSPMPANPADSSASVYPTHPWLQADQSAPGHSLMAGNAAYPSMPNQYMPANTRVPSNPWTQGNPAKPVTQTTSAYPTAPTYPWAQVNAPNPSIPAYPAYPAYPMAQTNISMPGYPTTPLNPTGQAATMSMVPGADFGAQGASVSAPAAVTTPPPVSASIPPHPVYSPGTAALVAQVPMYEELFLKNRPVGFDPGPRPPTPPRNQEREHISSSDWGPINTGWSSGLPYEGD